MNKIFINIQERVRTSLPEYYLKCFLDIQNKYGVKIYNLFLGSNNNKYLDINDLKEKGINILSYKSKKDLFIKINSLKRENTIYFVNTFTEQIIPLINKIKIELGQKVTQDFDLFRNKRKQRELLSFYPDIATKFKKLDYKNINLENILSDFSFPFVLKPSNGIQSSGVAIINNKEEFNKYIENFGDFLNKISFKININDLELIIEDYIDGDKYSIDYFVGEDGKIKGITQPIYNLSGKDIGIDDLFEFLIFASKDKIKKLDEKILDIFLNATIQATGIKNTFVHHEFKITSKGELKTIELNGRIGGYRLEMYLESSNINLFDFMFEKSGKHNIKIDFAVIQFYSLKSGILKDFNQDLVEKIKKLPSFFSINLLKNNIGKQVGLTKDGFGKVAALRLKHKESEVLNNDIIFVKNNFKNFLILE